MNEITNNKVNLCDSCSQTYPGCTSKPEDVYFGDGAGHDNICACSEYQPKSCGDGDTIYRQAAIDCCRNEWEEEVAERIEALPSAQPEYTEQDVRDAFNNGYRCGMESAQPENIARDIATIIENEKDMRVMLKNAQTERPKGKWVWNENGMDWGLGAWCCSECGRKPETWWESDKRHNPLRCAGSRFCGNCGADMRGEEDASSR